MKTVLKAVYSFFESLGRARAAAELARTGYHKEAQVIIQGK